MVCVSTILSLLGACTLYHVHAATIHTKVAILGGGVSGINAARNLSANGIDDFLIIEARDELGGRAQNADFARVKVELGCNWVQGLGTNPVNQLRKKYKLKTVKNDGDDVVFYGESGKVDFKDSMDRFNDAYDKMRELAEKRIKSNQVDLPARVGLDLSGWYPMDALDQAVEYYNFDWEDAENPEKSSMIYSVLSDEWTYSNIAFGPNSDGDRFVIDQRGFKYIFIKALEEVMKKDDPRIKLNTKVTEIAYNEKGVTIHTDTGDIIKAEYAICTFSLGVLQHKDVKWSPPLPSWKMEGLYGFDMATYTKIFLNFPRKFWDDNQYTVYAHPTKRGYFSVWQNLMANGAFNDTDANILFVTVTQDIAMQVDAMTDKEVQDEAMKILRSMYGPDIPEPTDILVPRWHSNPLFRGTYSNWPIGELSEHHANMKAPLLNRVFFAGEAMSTEFYGFLQGAWFSGAETGMEVVKCIKTKCAEAEYFPMITNARIQPDYITRRK